MFSCLQGFKSPARISPAVVLQSGRLRHKMRPVQTYPYVNGPDTNTESARVHRFRMSLFNGGEDVECHQPAAHFARKLLLCNCTYHLSDLRRWVSTHQNMSKMRKCANAKLA